MSPHPDAAVHYRCRCLGALVAALVAATALSSGAALAGTGGTSPKSSKAKSGPTLRIGSEGKLVKKLQTKLRVRPISGYYGSRTARKVKFFQQREGLTADGIAGPATLRALGLLSSGSGRGGGSGGGVKLPAVLKRIAKCESGGNPRAVSPDGRYRGKYQFDRATWEAYGGTGDPAKAPESVQDRIALKLYRARGTAPWPNCA
jgi:hypothetical protein